MDIDVSSFSKYKDLKFPKNGSCRFFFCASYFLYKKLIASHSLPNSLPPLLPCFGNINKEYFRYLCVCVSVHVYVCRCVCVHVCSCVGKHVCVVCVWPLCVCRCLFVH